YVHGGIIIMSNTKFSVLLSIYKNEKPEYVSKSLQSILNQSVLPNEIIIVEDGPLTDELYKTIGNFKREYPNVFKIVTLEQNVGLGLALNEGLVASSNELVARMDTDDIAKYNRFEKQIEVFKDN